MKPRFQRIVRRERLNGPTKALEVLMQKEGEEFFVFVLLGSRTACLNREETREAADAKFDELVAESAAKGWKR